MTADIDIRGVSKAYGQNQVVHGIEGHHLGRFRGRAPQREPVDLDDITDTHRAGVDQDVGTTHDVRNLLVRPAP